MITKETAIELFSCIRTHQAIKQISKTLDKYDVNDYVVFIRTRNNTFLHGMNCYSDVVKQLAHLIENAAEDLGETPHKLVEEVKVAVYNKQHLQMALEELFEQQDSLSHAEMVEEMRRIYKEHDVSDEQIDDILREL